MGEERTGAAECHAAHMHACMVVHACMHGGDVGTDCCAGAWRCAGALDAEFWSTAKATVDARDLALLRDTADMVRASRAASTWRTYDGPWVQFKAFCEERGYASMPALPLTVAMFLTAVAQQAASYAVVKTASAAIATHHEVAGCGQPPTKHALCKAVRQAAKRRLGIQVTHRKEPLAATVVVQLVQQIAAPEAPLLELMMALYASLCFAGFLRFDDAVQLRVRDITFGEGFAQLQLRKRKNDQFREGTTVSLAAGATAACPVTLLQRFIRESGWGPESFLFRAFDGHQARAGQPVQFREEAATYSQMHYHVLKRVAALLGISVEAAKQKYGLHSLRSGGTTAAHQAGVEPRLLQAHGGWKSEAVMQVYIAERIDKKLAVSKAVGL